MMKSNQGTYITSNTLISISKYDNILRFDSDDIMFPTLIEEIMKIEEHYEKIEFLMLNFGNLRNETYEIAVGQFLLKHWVFDLFGGFMPWICGADSELQFRTDQFLKIKLINKILMKRRIHSSSLTNKNETNYTSTIRKSYIKYIDDYSKNITKIENAIIIRFNSIL